MSEGSKSKRWRMMQRSLVIWARLTARTQRMRKERSAKLSDRSAWSQLASVLNRRARQNKMLSESLILTTFMPLHGVRSRLFFPT